MVSALAVNDLTAECQNVFLAAMKVGINPTEFTFSKILKSGAGSAVIGHVEQFHSMIFKLGLAGEMVVASSLIDIYSKQGSLGSAMKIFTEASFRDLPCWNSIIIGLAEHGRGVEALNLFKELQENCLKPDWITLMGVLSACSLHGLVDEGTHIFQKMEEKYGVERGIEHYNCILDMMIREGMLEEAMQIIKSIPWKFSSSVYDRLLDVCTAYGNIKLAELTANETVGLNTNSAFPYVVLARIYESRGQWEKAAWVKRAMEENSAWKPRDDSWIGLKNHIFTFESSGLQHWGGDTTYSVLRLLERHVQEFEATQSDNFVGTDKSNTLKEGDGGTSIDLFLDIHN